MPTTGSRFNFADVITNVLAITLAGSCGIFGGYMVLRLHAMDDPPVDLGLNFPETLLKTDPTPVLVDPIATQSISSAPAGHRRNEDIAQPYRAETPVLKYQLLSVFNGIAFIEVTDAKGIRLAPVSVGSRLQGAGIVERIEKADGHWRVIASGQVISETQ